MNQINLQPLSSKELDYIADSISSEDRQIKQCAVAATISQNPTIQQALVQYISEHEQHLQQLTDALQKHSVVAPTQAH
ncbi:spore coat protein CotF [Paenibacillus shirakamiensis]|uniref:Spore coat protein CotF n=1 Tax=Paenibacillus shirakamiensis TaxID=1265935 RepID=A0ABS4JFI7_9BACL|nr:spore coat protein [Paenibacillus shirakamiensis]MBP2000467.1 spore coat protein CotF [Paenibacillus shirakamiensis]